MRLFSSIFTAGKEVSIHASVKDATSCSYRLTDGRIVSIHASVKDATDTVFGYQRPWYVSIHASVKDATSYYLFYIFYSCCFNPRICKRCDINGQKTQNVSSVSIHASVKDATGNWICLLYTSPSPRDRG